MSLQGTGYRTGILLRLGADFLLWIPEEYGEEHANHAGISCEDVPGLRPVGRGVENVAGFDNLAGCKRAYGGTESVGHQHEHSLGTGTDVRGGVLIDIERTGDVEEVEGHSINDAAEHEEQYTGHRGIAKAEESETEHPCEHGDEHYLLDAEFLHAERNQQDTESLGSLADGDEGIGILDGEGICKSGIGGKGTEEGVCITVRYLERSAQEHAENEEDGELTVFEQAECLEAEGFCEALVFSAVGFACGHREGVCTEHKRDNTGRNQLGVAVLHGGSADFEEVGQQHAAYETYGAENADRREVLHRVHPCLAKGIVCYGIGDCDSRHIECDAQAVEHEEGCEFNACTGAHTVNSSSEHEQAGKPVAERQSLLRLNETVGDNAHKCGHENGNYALHGEEPLDLGAETDVAKVTPKRSEIGAPGRILEEIHQDEPDGKLSVFHYSVVC